MTETTRPIGRATAAREPDRTSGNASTAARRPQRSEWPTKQGNSGPGLASALSELRFVDERPNSLQELLAIAQRGAWTSATGGWLRTLAVVHVWTVQAPLLIVGCFLAWAARTPGRCWTVFPLVLTLATALNLIPVVKLLVPDWLTWPAWPPFCWIF